MSKQPPPSMTIESLKNEVSRLLQQTIPVLEVFHTLPFHNLWLHRAPGKQCLQFLNQTEKILLWCWQRLQDDEPERWQLEIFSWGGKQARKPDGLLQQYYQFYEALGNWAQQQSEDALRGCGMWNDYICFVLCHEPHLLKHYASAAVAPQREELELIAQHYLTQMQLIHKLDLYILCLDVFTFFGIFTRKSYFIPQLTFPIVEKEGEVSVSPFEAFCQRLQVAEEWSEFAAEYLDVIGIGAQSSE